MSEPTTGLPGLFDPAAAAAASPADDGVGHGDDFDRDRVLRLLGRLERDIAAVEVAMGHVEAGEHDAYEVAVSSLAPRLDD
jgi:hypothetical protein